MTKTIMGTNAKRRAENVTLPEVLLQDAHVLEVDVSQACEQGLAAAVADAKSQRWLLENQAAFDAWNEYVEQNGIPLAEYRQF